MFFMNQIKLVMSDLDGTLLNDNKEIDSKILDVIKSLYENTKKTPEVENFEIQPIDYMDKEKCIGN